MKKIGFVLVLAGVIWGAIAFNMSTTVSTGGQRIGSGEHSIYVPPATVNNLGLMEDRRNHLLGAGFTAVVGAILLALGGGGGGGQYSSVAGAAGARQCPYCAEFVKSEAKICRFCRHDLPSLADLAAQAEVSRMEIAELAKVDIEAAKVAEELLPKGSCPNCQKQVPFTSLECKHCGAMFGARGGWSVLPIIKA